MEAATKTSAAGRLNIFPNSYGSKHIKLDFCPCVYLHPWLVVDLPVFLPKLRSQIDEVVGGPVAPDSLSVSKAKLYS